MDTDARIFGVHLDTERSAAADFEARSRRVQRDSVAGARSVVGIIRDTVLALQNNVERQTRFLVIADAVAARDLDIRVRQRKGVGIEIIACRAVAEDIGAVIYVDAHSADRDICCSYAKQSAYGHAACGHYEAVVCYCNSVVVRVLDSKALEHIFVVGSCGQRNRFALVGVRFIRRYGAVLAAENPDVV